jgi:hypothetical protein
MVQVLNNLTNDYELHIVLMEKRIGNKENPLTIDKIREEFIFRYESLSLLAEITNEIDMTGEKAMFTTQFKRIAESEKRLASRRQIARLDVIDSQGLRLK